MCLAGRVAGERVFSLIFVLRGFFDADFKLLKRSETFYFLSIPPKRSKSPNLPPQPFEITTPSHTTDATALNDKTTPSRSPGNAHVKCPERGVCLLKPRWFIQGTHIRTNIRDSKVKLYRLNDVSLLLDLSLMASSFENYCCHGISFSVLGGLALGGHAGRAYGGFVLVCEKVRTLWR